MGEGGERGGASKVSVKNRRGVQSISSRQYSSPPQHPRVRYAACNAIGQMATDFAPTFQKKFHEKVPRLLLSTS